MSAANREEQIVIKAKRLLITRERQKHIKPHKRHISACLCKETKPQKCFVFFKHVYSEFSWAEPKCEFWVLSDFFFGDFVTLTSRSENLPLAFLQCFLTLSRPPQRRVAGQTSGCVTQEAKRAWRVVYPPAHRVSRPPLHCTSGATTWPWGAVTGL